MVSPLDDSHISCFEVLLLINLALYHVSARTLFSMCFSKMLVARVFFFGCYTPLHNDKGSLESSMFDLVS